MKLVELKIKEYDNWRNVPNQPDYTGSITLKGEEHSITMRVNKDLVEKIIELCADSIVECAKETASIMKSEIINQTKQIQKATD